MTDDLTTSIACMREVVRRMRAYPFPPGEEDARDTIVEILEEQIAEMEQQRKGAWS